MSRLAAIAILLSAPLFAQPAAAQDCLCVMDAGFGLFEAETPDTTIESRALEHDAGAASADAPRGPSRRTVLWCASADDPRCQPMQPSDVPTPRALSGGSVGATIGALSRGRRRSPVEMTMTPSLGLAPSVGVRISLDRPPRG